MTLCYKACRGVADHLKKVNLRRLKMDDFCITIRDKDNSFGVPYFRNHVDMTNTATVTFNKGVAEFWLNFELS